MTQTTRRQLLTTGGAALAGAAMARQLPTEELDRWLARPQVAWAAGRTTPLPPPSAEVHLLNRATWGPTPGEAARLRVMGADAWLDEQLAPATIDDRTAQSALAALASLGWTGAQIKANWGKHPVRNELVAATLYRAVASRRQLLEVMVDHWSNVFNVFHPEEFISAAKTLDDRDVIRAHALGRFRDLLHASAASPAMMRYLNVVQNVKGGANENYAREVMELHALGVAVNGAPYSEQDVKQVARAFTGWGYNRDSWAFEFNAANHDAGAKTVLGAPLTKAGVDEGHEVLDRLVDHPACARHVARRLVRRFVDDTAPETLVAEVAAAFGRDGDIPAMLRALFGSDVFRQSYARSDKAPAKVRRPLEAWVAALRASGADAAGLLDVPVENYEGDDGPGSVVYDGRAERALQLMDHLPFRWRSPDGYPDSGPRWGGMHVMVSRWNFGVNLAEGAYANVRWSALADQRAAGVTPTPAALVDYWAGRLVQRPLLAADRQRLIDYLGAGSPATLTDQAQAARVPVLAALLLDSPYGQWR